MSDQKKIVEDLFQQQRSKKQKNQKAKPTGQTTTAPGGKKRDGAEDKKLEAQQPALSQQQDFAESSDEETKIELDEKSAVIKDAKEVEASKRKENEKEQQDIFGWGGLDRKAQANRTFAPEKTVPTKASGATGGMEMDSLKASVSSKQESNIQFKGKEQFQFQKSKNAIKQEEFPELGNQDKKAQPAVVSKKDGTYGGQFSSTTATGKPKEQRDQRPAEEVKEVKEAKMPVFTKKMKVTTTEAQSIENIPQQQTYDFSKMKLSAASAKVPRQEGEQQEPNERGERGERQERQERGERTNRGDFGGRGRGGRGGFDRAGDRPVVEDKESDDSFEEVKDKRRGPQKFSRGGKNYSKDM